MSTLKIATLPLLLVLSLVGCTAADDFSLTASGRFVNPATGKTMDLNQIKLINICYTARLDHDSRMYGDSLYDCRDFIASTEPQRKGSEFDGKVGYVDFRITDLDKAEFEVKITHFNPSDSETTYEIKSLQLEAMLQVKNEFAPDTFTLEYLRTKLGFDCPVPRWHGTDQAIQLDFKNGGTEYQAANPVVFSIDPFDPKESFGNAPPIHGARNLSTGKCRY